MKDSQHSSISNYQPNKPSMQYIPAQTKNEHLRINLVSELATLGRRALRAKIWCFFPRSVFITLNSVAFGASNNADQSKSQISSKFGCFWTAPKIGLQSARWNLLSLPNHRRFKFKMCENAADYDCTKLNSWNISNVLFCTADGINRLHVMKV